MIMPRQQPSESRQEDSRTVDAAQSGSRHYIVGRALKKAILNRKNALFYKTLNGGRWVISL
jgi:hypothetical protein